MTHAENLKMWKKRRMKIYEEVMKGKESQRKIAPKYGISNERVRQIVKKVEKDNEIN